jgi:hypothetical protein
VATESATKRRHPQTFRESHQKYLGVEYDANGLDEAVPALLYLNSFENHWEARTRKDMAWEPTERIYEEGPIGGPEGKAKSVVLTAEDRYAAEQAFPRIVVPRTPA